MEASLADLEGVCPNCGHWDRLNELTGWCLDCTLIANPSLKACSTCGGLYPKSAQVEQCWNCRKEVWLSTNAEEIEKYMIHGLSFTAACEQVADDIRPHCKNCGDEIRGGRRAANFCNKKAECRRASKQYRTLQQQGLTPDDALAIATGRALILVSNTETGEQDGC